MIMDQLFAVDALDVALTSDDWYTPPWLFEAAGLVFDMDVAAPVDPSRRTCPARAYLTPVEDGLVSPWHGLVWCNPPYSNAGPWVTRFAKHEDGGLMLTMGARARWVGELMGAADALSLVAFPLGRPDGRMAGAGAMMILTARGDQCVSALARIAAVDTQARGAYLVRPG